MKDFPEGLPPAPGQASRVLDGIMPGAARVRSIGRGRLRSTWILVARGSEPVEEFFLESPFAAEDEPTSRDPFAWICRGVRADGTLRLGAVDLDIDRFVSDVLGRTAARDRK